MNPPPAPRLISRLLSLLLLPACATAIASTSTPLHIEELARQCPRFGLLTPAEAARSLERIITRHQDQRHMQQHLGVSPSIQPLITSSNLLVTFRVFDQYARSPVAWSREQNRMRTFNASWSNLVAITLLPAPPGREQTPRYYLDLRAADKSSTRIPLTGPFDTGELQTLCLALGVLAELFPTPPPRPPETTPAKERPPAPPPVRPEPLPPPPPVIHTLPEIPVLSPSRIREQKQWLIELLHADHLISNHAKQHLLRNIHPE